MTTEGKMEGKMEGETEGETKSYVPAITNDDISDPNLYIDLSQFIKAYISEYDLKLEYKNCEGNDINDKIFITLCGTNIFDYKNIPYIEEKTKTLHTKSGEKLEVYYLHFVNKTCGAISLYYGTNLLKHLTIGLRKNKYSERFESYLRNEYETEFKLRIEWYITQKLKSIRIYQDNINKGIEFYHNGKIKKIYTETKDYKPCDKVISWYPNGKIEYIEHYKHGKKSKCTYWDEDGKLKSTYHNICLIL